LEKEGVIKEYCMIPDFTKVGYSLFAATFVKLRKQLSREELGKARQIAKEDLKGSLNFIMLERGMGLDYDGIFLSFHEDYSSVMQLKTWLEQFNFLQVDKIHSFIVSLEDEIHYRPLTFSTLAKHILTLATQEKRRISQKFN
jgi:DNA-binding Lrp family transcriptional regulator